MSQIALFISTTICTATFYLSGLGWVGGVWTCVCIDTICPARLSPFSLHCLFNARIHYTAEQSHLFPLLSAVPRKNINKQREEGIEQQLCLTREFCHCQTRRRQRKKGGNNTIGAGLYLLSLPLILSCHYYFASGKSGGCFSHLYVAAMAVVAIPGGEICLPFPHAAAARDYIAREKLTKQFAMRRGGGG